MKNETKNEMRRMGREEFAELKAKAHELMQQDYEWMLSQEPASSSGHPPKRRRWRCPRRWIVEFVYDVNGTARPTDELLRRIPLERLYNDFLAHIGHPPLPRPSTQLSKLRAQEQRNDISPDYITLYYMREMQKGPSCRIIELLMEEEEEE